MGEHNERASSMSEVQKSLLEQATAETWACVEGHEDYWISRNGVVARITILTPWINTEGYPCVAFYEKGHKSQHSLHRLLAKAFIPNPLNLEQVNHIDSNRENYALSNLEWNTQVQNQHHSWRSNRTARLKTHPRGETHGMSKLTAEQVVCIRHFCGIWRQRSIARHFGISQHTVMAVRRGIVWNHVPGAASQEPSTIRTHKRGETNGCAKLTETQVREIRTMKGIDYSIIANRFGVSPSLVGLIIRRERWGHIQ